MCEHTFPCPRTAPIDPRDLGRLPLRPVRGALKTRNLPRSAPRPPSWPRLALDDALEVCLIVRDTHPERFDAAAVRWIGRYRAERPNITLELLDAVEAAFRELQRVGLERLHMLTRNRAARS